MKDCLIQRGAKNIVSKLFFFVDQILLYTFIQKRCLD